MDDVSRLRGIGEKCVGLYKKGKIRVQVIIKIMKFSFIQRIVISRIQVGFMFRLRVQILDPRYCTRTRTHNQYNLSGFRHRIRSRSTIDLGEFFSELGCIG
jgi:hypothetical protein